MMLAGFWLIAEARARTAMDEAQASLPSLGVRTAGFTAAVRRRAYRPTVTAHVSLNELMLLLVPHTGRYVWAAWALPKNACVLVVCAR